MGYVVRFLFIVFLFGFRSLGWVILLGFCLWFFCLSLEFWDSNVVWFLFMVFLFGCGDE